MKKKFVVVLTTMLFVILCSALSACEVEHTHTPNADDGDCATDVTCSVCQEVTTAGSVHIPNTNWSNDETVHWKMCTNEGCTTVAVEKSNHTPNTDEGDCTIAVPCSVCLEVIPAKKHSPRTNWRKDDSQHWKICTNEGCTEIAVERANHTPNTDDGDCKTAVPCSVCQKVTTPSRVHASATWNIEDGQHWKKCTNAGCTKLAVEKASHTPNIDDGDCTTANNCSVCQDEIPAKSHIIGSTWGKDETNHWKICSNEGCTAVLGEKISHSIKSGFNACECGNNVDVSMFTITEGQLISCIPGEYTSITIPSSVTKIGDSAFRDCRGLTSIDIPSSVTNIADSAFRNCSGLISITIPSSVTYIGDSAFRDCRGLTSIDIPNSVTYIGDSAFRDCRELTSIDIPSSVTYIGSNAFYCCRGLMSITIPNSVTHIYSSAFGGCSGLTSITIPSSVTYIGPEAFGGCSSLASITVEEGNTKYHSAGNSIIETSTKTLIVGCKNSSIPTDGSVTSIGYSAFYSCSGLTSLTIPNSVTDIASSAFSWCSSLTSITIPSSVISIGSYAFYGCSGGLTIYAETSEMPGGWVSNWNPSNCAIVWNYKNNEVATDGNIYYVAENGVRYAIKDNVASIIVQSRRLGGSIDIPSAITYKDNSYSVTAISERAFYYCSELTSITIPSSMISIGGFAFRGCTSLVSITIGNGVISIGDSAFEGCTSLASITIGNGVISIGASAFKGCTSLASITIPSSVISIGVFAFDGCTSLASITIENGVTSIGAVAFYNCSSLASITIPSSVISIGDGAFVGCVILTIYAEASAKPSGWANNWCSHCPVVWNYRNNEVADDCNIYYIAENGVRYALKDNVATVVRQSIGLSGAIDIPSTISYKNNSYRVTAISSYAFLNCSSLASINIPESVTNIEHLAFLRCYELANITVAKGNKMYHSAGNCIIETVTKTLILGCKNSIIPTDGSVTSIGNSAFFGCSGLTSIIIPNSVTVISSSAFYDCSSLASIIIPNSVTVISDSAFSGCSSLASITIPASVTSIGSYAFRGCSSLASITVAEGNTTYHSAGNNLIETATKTLILGCKNSCIPTDGSVTAISDYAFYNCRGLTNIDIPSSVTNIGDSTFYNCRGLTSITIPDGVKIIGNYTFQSCYALTSITIPASVKSIGNYVFQYCNQLTSITYNGTLAQWEAITKGAGWNSGTLSYTITCTDGTLTKTQL